MTQADCDIRDYGKKVHGLEIEFDETIHYTDTWLAMEKLVAAGLVRSIGVSNFNSVQIDKIIQKGSIVPAINQVEEL